MVRQVHELTDNKRLLEKHVRIEALIEGIRDEAEPDDELAYVSIFHFSKFTFLLCYLILVFKYQLVDLITPAEKSLVAKINRMNDNLTLGQTQVDETILILETYLKFLEPKWGNKL